MSYKVVFDLAGQPPFDLGAALLALVLVAAGTIWEIIQRQRARSKNTPPPKGLTTPRVLMGMGFLIALVGIGLIGWDHWRLLKAMKNGEARVVEGPVQSYGTERVRTANTKKQEYRTYERFYVGDSIWFGYFWDAEMAGFYNQNEPRFEFKDGMIVRATYLYADGTDDPPRIVKLEIADTSGTPQP